MTETEIKTFIEKAIDLKLTRPELIVHAMTHKSYGPENMPNNEKLEFLGDAVLDLALADLLMAKFPDNDEGRLSKKRASLVNEKELSDVAFELGLQDCLRLGKSEIISQGALKPRLLSSSLEALFGAVYLDLGYETAKTLSAKLFRKKLERDDGIEDFTSDFKTRFQEMVQARERSTPTYRVVSEKGPPHARIFEVQAETESRVWATAEGHSKKMAEQMAARLAIAVFQKEGLK